MVFTLGFIDRVLWGMDPQGSFPEFLDGRHILHQTVSRKFTVEKSKIVWLFGKSAGNAYVWNLSSRWEGGPHCERR